MQHLGNYLSVVIEVSLQTGFDGFAFPQTLLTRDNLLPARIAQVHLLSGVETKVQGPFDLLNGIGSSSDIKGGPVQLNQIGVALGFPPANSHREGGSWGT